MNLGWPVFIEAKDDGRGGDNWSYKSCKAPAKSSPPTNQHPAFLQAGCPSCRPTNSVVALKGEYLELTLCNIEQLLLFKLCRVLICRSCGRCVLQLHTFKGPHWCDFCANFLWGLIAQGVKCQGTLPILTRFFVELGAFFTPHTHTQF